MSDHLDWLPLASRRAIRAEEAREYREDQAARLDQEKRAEAKRSADLALYAAQAEQRGEHVSAMALATGIGVGRSAAEILAHAEAMANIEDARAKAKADQAENGPPEYCFGPPAASRAESPESREVLNTVRHYVAEHPEADVIDRAFIASETRKRQQRERPVI